MFNKLEKINGRPEVFGVYTAESLWSDAYRAKQMLALHLNENIDVSSRNHQFIGKSVDWIYKKFAIRPGFRICDFGCGPGLYASRLAKLGAVVTGIDFSRNSIDYAKSDAARQELDIEYIYANYLEVNLEGQYDLIIMIMCDFCALSPGQRKSLLMKFKNLLSPTGKLLLDVYSINYFSSRDESAVYEKNHLNHFWYDEDYYCFSNAFKYPNEKVLLDKYSLFSQSGKYEVVYNWLQCYDTESLRAEFKESGLRIESIYSDVSGNEYDSASSEFAVIADQNN